MKSHVNKLRNLLVLTLLTFVVFNCKNESKSNATDDQDKELVSSKRTNKSEERKTPTGIVTVQFDGETVEFTDFDPTITTDVVFLPNGIQFRINSLTQKIVLVNMYSPNLLDKIPISISQQSYALPAGESLEVETQSRLEVTIPSVPEKPRDYMVLYEGVVTLSELSENKLVVTFSGTGLPIADSKMDLFPLEGKIVLENFNVYDMRE